MNSSAYFHITRKSEKISQMSELICSFQYVRCRSHRSCLKEHTISQKSMFPGETYQATSITKNIATYTYRLGTEKGNKVIVRINKIRSLKYLSEFILQRVVPQRISALAAQFPNLIAFSLTLQGLNPQIIHNIQHTHFQVRVTSLQKSCGFLYSTHFIPDRHNLND